MLPYIIKTDFFAIPSFFAAISLSALFATLIIMREAKLAGLDKTLALDICLDLIIFAILGARLGHVLWESPLFYFHNPLRIFAFWSGGFVSLGAILTDLIVLIYVCWRKKLDFWKWFDVIIVGATLVFPIVRLGCVGAGCCYGNPTHSHFGLIYTDPDSIARPLGVPLIPTQLIELIYGTLIFLLIIFLRRRKSFDGQLALSFLMLYPFCRFFLEFLRGDADRGIYFGGAISTAQIITIPLFITSLIIYILRRKKELKGHIT